MRRKVRYGAALTVASLVVTAAPTQAVRQILPTSTQTVVPWRQLPPRPESTVPLPAPVTTTCRAGALSLVSASSGIWHGWMVTVTLQARGTACALPQIVRLEGSRPDGSWLRLRWTATPPGPPLRPSAGKNGEVTLSLYMPYCRHRDQSVYAAPRSRTVRGARVTFASGQVIALPGQSLNDSCGLSMSLSRTLGDLDTTTVPQVRRLPGWGDVRAEGPLPSTLVRGTTATFDVTLHNVTRRPFSLATCPNWTITFLPFQTKGKVLYQAHGRLNCAQAPPTIPRFGSVTFAMRYRVPLNAATGVAGFSWNLDQTGAWVHSNNPTTGDALVS